MARRRRPRSRSASSRKAQACAPDTMAEPSGAPRGVRGVVPPADRCASKGCPRAPPAALGGLQAGYQDPHSQSPPGPFLGAAVAAGDRRVELVPADVVEHARRRVDRPLVPPGAQHGEHRAQLQARLGELVLVARRVLAVLPPLHHAARFEGAQPRGNEAPSVARCAGVPGDLVEPLVAEGDLAARRAAPRLLADQVQGGRHRAREACRAGSSRMTREPTLSSPNQTHSGYAGLVIETFGFQTERCVQIRDPGV